MTTIIMLIAALLISTQAVAQLGKGEDGHFHGVLPPRAPSPAMPQWDIDTICRRPFKLCGYDWSTNRTHVWKCRLNCGCEDTDG